MNESDKNLVDNISRLTQVLERFDRRLTYPRTFFMGILSGLGSAIGATAVFALLVYFVGKIDFIPIIGDWVVKIVDQVAASFPQNPTPFAQ